MDETPINDKILLDFIPDNGGDDSEEDDDQIKDTEDDQDFDKELIADGEQGIATAKVSEPDELPSYDDDEEQEISDSGIGESDTSSIEGPSCESPVIPQVRIIFYSYLNVLFNFSLFQLLEVDVVDLER
jgi:hypothetical protein